MDNNNAYVDTIVLRDIYINPRNNMRDKLFVLKECP